MEGGQRKGIANETAQGLHLGRNHGNNFTLAHLAEGGQGEAQHTGVKFKPQTAQHTLASQALVYIDDVFEALINAHQDQEQRAQQKQVWRLIKGHLERPQQWDLQAEQGKGHCLAQVHGIFNADALNGLVDDGLGNFVKQIQKRQ